MKKILPIIIIFVFSLNLSPCRAIEAKPMKITFSIFDKHQWLDDGMGVEGVGFSVLLPERLFNISNLYIGLLGFNLNWDGTWEENPTLYNWNAGREMELQNWRNGTHNAIAITISKHFEPDTRFFSHFFFTFGKTEPAWMPYPDTKTMSWSEYGKSEPKVTYYDQETYFFRVSFRPIKVIPGTISLQLAKVPERGIYPTFAFGIEPIFIIKSIKY